MTWPVSIKSFLITSVILAQGIASGSPALPVDLGGSSVDPPANDRSEVVVLVFAGVDCPISNRYVPTVNRLYQDYASADTSFWYVYPGSHFNKQDVKSHVREYNIMAPALIDRDGYLVRKAQATVTPEVAVYLTRAAGSEYIGWIYRGRIDDRYTDFGKWRLKPSRQDLKEVLQSLADGQRPAFRETTAIGCYISE